VKFTCRGTVLVAKDHTIKMYRKWRVWLSRHRTEITVHESSMILVTSQTHNRTGGRNVQNRDENEQITIKGGGNSNFLSRSYF
jgi:hypothetical protein